MSCTPIGKCHIFALLLYFLKFTYSRIMFNTFRGVIFGTYQPASAHCFAVIHTAICIFFTSITYNVSDIFC